MRSPQKKTRRDCEIAFRYGIDARSFPEWEKRAWLANLPALEASRDLRERDLTGADIDALTELAATATGSRAEGRKIALEVYGRRLAAQADAELKAGKR